MGETATAGTKAGITGEAMEETATAGIKAMA